MYEKWRRHIFFRIKDPNTWANLCKKILIQHPSKMRMQSSQWAKNVCDNNGFNKSINSEKGIHKDLDDLLNCALTLLFIYFVKIEGVLRYTKLYPQNGKKCPNCTKKFSRNFVEHIHGKISWSIFAVIITSSTHGTYSSSSHFTSFWISSESWGMHLGGLQQIYGWLPVLICNENPRID